MSSELSTREKILHISHKLFADRGLNGVSVREIAKECDVNIAAINYHFNNKENLYLETIRCSVLETEEEIHQLYESLNEINVEDFVLKVYDHFLDNSEDLRTGFKLVISSDHFAEAMGNDIERFNGPPGGEYFAKSLMQEIPSASEEDIGWAVRVLFTQVIHKALMVCNKSICDSLADNGVTADVLRQDIKRLVKMVKTEITK